MKETKQTCSICFSVADDIRATILTDDVLHFLKIIASLTISDFNKAQRYRKAACRHTLIHNKATFVDKFASLSLRPWLLLLPLVALLAYLCSVTADLRTVREPPGDVRILLYTPSGSLERTKSSVQPASSHKGGGGGGTYVCGPSCSLFQSMRTVTVWRPLWSSLLWIGGLYGSLKCRTDVLSSSCIMRGFTENKIHKQTKKESKKIG